MAEIARTAKMAKKAKIEALMRWYEQNVEELRAVKTTAKLNREENKAYEKAIAMNMAKIANLRSALGKNECGASSQQPHPKKG